ncbi:hypothetical protein [Amycolatopsis sp. DG1A-15b]|uniref:hypothetical protein n=1 Tax=Amycolatopsis sp. DG1A-15b TaxID=3052846 RepID=UPI00255B80DF|nr:hypothetical protein [Amycolatopsis sp. DG1A-15b]WIX85053.1 hypothetical protein QRY02_27890 [Amycolatopsis sp. DG1A-15b]
MTEESPPEPVNHIAGDVVGSALQVGAVHGDMYVGFAQAAAPVSIDPPTNWSGLPELPPKIVSLLRAQLQNAEKMPYRLPGARRPSLATVYVRQDVTTGTELQPSDQARPLPVLDGKGRLIDFPGPPPARLTVRPPSRSMREALDGGEHLLVTGGPGQGKSTLSLRLAAEAARCWQGVADSPPLREPVLPLRLTARELATRLELPFYEALAESVRGEYGAMLAQPLRPEDLTGRVAGCRWLLLVDGLDEVADAALRDQLVTVLAAWASDAVYRVVLTTRPIEGATLAPFQRIGAARYELLPFDEGTFRLFAGHWFAESAGAAERFVRQIRDAHLDELVRVPLLATIAAIIFEKYADRPLPDNQYELYETYLEYLRSAHSVPPGPFDSCCGRLLEYLGRVRLEEDTSLSAAACRWVGEKLPELGAETGWRERLIGHLAAVGPFLFRADDLGFLHHSFAEHLAATANARLLPETFDPAHQDFAELLHAAEPEERGRYARRVLLHYTRLRPAEADRLIQHLHGNGPQQHLLAARLLAWHVPAGTDVMTAFLETARAWAATTQYPGGKILAEVSRAAHHPELVGWLQSLMRDDGLPWPSRVEAAVALGTRLDNDARAEAVGMLRTVVRSVGIDVRARLDAVDALSQCGDDEREAAVLGLEAVLESPAVTATQHGDAAVVLAGLGAGPRARAIGALTAVLDSSSATGQDLVAAAVSLLEIDIEFHERCATVLLAVLNRRSWSTSGVENAAIGLASLGPDYLAEAADALEHRASDPRLHHFDRLQGARTLSRLGPQHRMRAGELILELATSPVAGTFDRAYIASVLAGCGPEFHQRMVALIHSVVDDPAAAAGYLYSAGSRLADLGPDHWSDAAGALIRAADHPLQDDQLAMDALGTLAGLGEPHRAQALAGLRSAMNQPESTVETRYWAASELARLGPEFHPEAIGQLVRLTAASLPLKLRLEVWRQLERLAPELDQRAPAGMIGLQLVQEGNETWGEGLPHDRWDVPDPDELARILERVIDDRERSGRQRYDAAIILTWMHHRFHAAAARGIVRLIRDDVIDDSEIIVTGIRVGRAGAAIRSLVAAVLLERVLAPGARPGRIYGAAAAMDALDSLDVDGVRSALGRVVADFSADAKARCYAAILLAGNNFLQPDAAFEIIFRLCSKIADYSWIRSVRSAVELGADVVENMRGVVLDRDVDRYRRQEAAVLLTELVPGRTSEWAAELMSEAEDPFIDAGCRSSAMTRLVSLHPGTASMTAAALRTTMEDERRSIDHRCDAAYELARIGSAGEYAHRTLLRFAGDPELTQEERGDALRLLSYFRTDGPTIRCRLALAQDPAVTSGKIRAAVLRDLTGRERRSVGRALVSDRLVSPETWAGCVTRWNDGPFALEAERELLDRLTGPESAPADRINAAVALSKIAPALEPRAVEELEKLSHGNTAARRAWRELALLDNRWCERVIADAQAVLADAERPGRERAEAGLVLIDLTSELPGACQKHLEELSVDGRIADRLRLRVLFDLRRLDDVRAIRDDQHRPLSLRRDAAKKLTDYCREDRVAAAELFQAIAADQDCHPRLRWWAADDLAELGARGHELGTAALESLMKDESLPMAARTGAAGRLGAHRPDLRGEVLRVLRGFRGERNVRVWTTIGEFEPEEGAVGLLDMARDRTLGRVVRCRSAWAAARLHRSHREAAAVVAREIAHDDETPLHIRVSAARLLAAASNLCRAEARELLEGHAAGPKRRR